MDSPWVVPEDEDDVPHVIRITGELHLKQSGNVVEALGMSDKDVADAEVLREGLNELWKSQASVGFDQFMEHVWSSPVSLAAKVYVTYHVGKAVGLKIAELDSLKDMVKTLLGK